MPLLLGFVVLEVLRRRRSAQRRGHEAAGAHAAETDAECVQKRGEHLYVKHYCMINAPAAAAAWCVSSAFGAGRMIRTFA